MRFAEQMGEEDLRQFYVVAVLSIGYFALQLLANLTVQKPVQIFGTLVVPAGSLLYAITFIWVDMVNDRLGAKRATALVVGCVIFQVFSIAWFEIYLSMPYPVGFSDTRSVQEKIEYVFGGYTRIYIASIVTILIAENINIYVFNAIKRRCHTWPRFMRSFVSNSVSVPVDGALFPALAFIGVMNNNEVISIILSSIAYKLFVSYVSIPLLYLVRSRRLNNKGVVYE